MNAAYKVSCLHWLEVNLLHTTIGEKNLTDSLVIFSPHGKSCMKSVLNIHLDLLNSD